MDSLITHSYSFRVQYPDVDQMGTVHHATYVKYFEVARWELFRHIGIPYHQIEEAGYLLPVIDMHFKFVKTTHYDAMLTVRTQLRKVKGVRIWFDYELFDEQSQVICRAETELAFVNRKTWRPCLMPSYVQEAIDSHACIATHS